MTARSASDDGWAPSGNPWLIAVVVTLATFMEILDTTIVNVSLPHIAGNLSTTYDDATWCLTSYLAANGIVLAISGWLSRVLGRKRYFLICIAMFVVTSFLCGIASSLPELIIFRLLQGFFGGGLQPVQQAIILDIFPPEKRAAAFSLTAIAVIVAPVLGPALGGWITDNSSWRWIFFINVPVGLFALFAVAALVDDPPWARKGKQSIDAVGLCLITIGIGCLEVMVDRGEDDDWFGSAFICWMGFFAAVGLVGAVVWLLHTKKPVVDLRVLKDRNFAVGTLLIGMLGGILYAGAVIVPQYAQQIAGYTAFLAGLVLSPGGLIVMVLIPFVGRLMHVVQLRYMVAFGFFFEGAALFYSANLVPLTDFYHLVLFRALQAAALAFLFVPISTIAYATLAQEKRGDASALFNMSRNVVGSLSISLVTALLTETRQGRQAYLSQWATVYHQPFNDYLAQARHVARGAGVAPSQVEATAQHIVYSDFLKQTAILAYNDVFMVLGTVAMLAVPLCFLFSPMKGKGSGGGGVH